MAGLVDRARQRLEDILNTPEMQEARREARRVANQIRRDMERSRAMLNAEREPIVDDTRSKKDELDRRISERR